MTLLDAAIACARRGWAICPCKPGGKANGKATRYGGGYKDATTDEAQIQKWWSDHHDDNPAIAPGKSGITALDIDTGLTDEDSLRAFMRERRIPETFAVRTGKRPQFRVQLYFAGCGGESFNGWEDPERAGFRGDLRSTWGHVMAPGAIHGESGAAYAVLWDLPLAPVPEWVRHLKPKHKDNATGKREWALPVHDGEGRDDFLIQQAGRLRNAGADEETILLHLQKLNMDPSVMADPKPDEDLDRIARSAARYEVPAPDPVVVLGTPKPQTDGPPRTLGEVLKRQAEEKAAVRESFTDWREMFHATDDILGCSEPSFLIQDFLQHQAIQAIAAPVGQRKSLIALNVARSLSTGQPLFGFLPVVNRPSRVLYLCPEMGTTSISQRIKNAGLSDHVNKSLFVRSMNLPRMDLLDFPVAALPGSVLILDTAIRFMQGDENSAKDMRMFSDLLFDIQRLQGPNGAIIILYHSPKTTKDTFELTLENCLRGSGELGAAVTDGWGTRMQDPDAGWDSTNFIKHIKVRDYPGPKDFEVSCDKPTGILTRIGNPDVAAVLSVKKSGPKADPEEAERGRAYIKENPNMTVKQLMAGGQTVGINHKRNWWTDRRIEVRGGGSVLRSE